MLEAFIVAGGGALVSAVAGFVLKAAWATTKEWFEKLDKRLTAIEKKLVEIEARQATSEKYRFGERTYDSRFSVGE